MIDEGPGITERERRDRQEFAGIRAFAPLGESDPAWVAMRTAREKLTEANNEDERETAFARLHRVMRHEKLIAGLQDMLLCRHVYALTDATCEEIRRLLREN